ANGGTLTSSNMAAPPKLAQAHPDPSLTGSPSFASAAQLTVEWQFEAAASCPACQSVEATTVVKRTVRGFPLEFSRCGNCSLIYQNPRLTRNSLANYFSSKLFIQDPDGHRLHEFLGYSNYFDWDPSYRKTARLRLERLAKFKQPPGDLLEIGTATGSFLDAARSFGFRVRGLDLSSTFAAIARET